MFDHSRIAVYVALSLSLLCATAATHAATISVTTFVDAVADDGACSLREAVLNSNNAARLFTSAGECAGGGAANVIDLPSGEYSLTIAATGSNDATTGDLNITRELTLTGTGNSTIKGGAGWADRIFSIAATGPVAISGVAISGGNVNVSSSVNGGGGIRVGSPLTLTAVTISGNTATQSAGLAIGGGIYVATSGSLTLANSTVSGNTAPQGGGLWLYGDTSIIGSTISGNRTSMSSFLGAPGIATVDAQVSIVNSTIQGNVPNPGVKGAAGAIGMDAFSTMNPKGHVTLNNVTIADNAGSETGGIYSDAGAFTMSNALIQRNTGDAPDCFVTGVSSITSNGNNIIGDGTGCVITGVKPTDRVGTSGAPVLPLLGTLANNGGPTRTIALQPGSVALDAGNAATCASTDQRGVARPQGAACDIGAFEVALDEIKGTAVEFFNSILKHYFVTASAPEQASIDTGGSGPGWERTGLSFKSGGVSRVCRFYGTPGVGPNSHFYTVSAPECAQVKLDPGWHFESYDFSSTAPASPNNCPADTVPVYRAYNGRFAANDSNHRLTTSVAAYNATVADGWTGEGVVMCAPN